ncbi:MAG: sulfite exporter TauE/SafE family protein [Pseudomonadota bacterium]
MDATYILLGLGGLAGGFISGLTGFGTGLAAMPFWLLAAAPPVAAQLAAAAAVIGQIQTIRVIWPAVRWRNLGHFVIAGLIGVPIGTLLLPMVPADVFKLGVGIFLVGFCAFMLLARQTWLLTKRRFFGDVAIGFGGGVLGGLSGLPGPLPIAWASLHDWPRDEKRALFQVFNFAVLSAMLAASAVAGLMTSAVFIGMAIVVPGVLLGNHIGVIVYRRLDARRFDRIVLAILLLSGLGLIISNI